MLNRLRHKSILIILSALFFVAGIGIFAPKALATGETWASLGNPYPYVLKTIPDALTPKNKDAYDALPYADFYKKRVRTAVDNYFKTGGGGEMTFNDVTTGRIHWEEAYVGKKAWIIYEANPYGNKPNEFSTETWSIQTPYASLADATNGEENWRIFLNAADTAYIDELNDAARDSIDEQLNKIEIEKNKDKAALAQEEFEKCMTAAGESQDEKDLCDKAKQAQLAEIQKAADKTGVGAVVTETAATAGQVGTSVTEGAEITGALLQGGVGAGLVGPPPPQAGQLTQDDASLAKEKPDLTADQKAKAEALAANQEVSSEREDALMAAIKAACEKDWFFSMNCLAEVPYYFIYRPASWLMLIAGYMFDASLALSINKSIINQPFVTESWTVIRDFSNMLFIFILLYTGIQTILGMGDWRKTVLHIVIIALLINFSLFFTKVVIDAGNILAVGVYQSMGVTKDAKTSMLKSGMGIDVPERDLSASLVANFRPQQFLARAGATDTWNTIIVFIIAAVVNVAVAYVLFKVALLFIGRLLAFWVLMILSPFAFISFTLKGPANIFGWWTETLIGQAFVAPVFLFLLYLIMTVISAGNSGIMGVFSK